MQGFSGRGALLPALALLCGIPAAAEEFDAETRDLEHVQVTATRRAANEFDVSAAISQVDEVSIRAENPDVLAEMLRGLPGTFFQQTTPGQGIPIIRGLKGSQVLHLVDGMRLNNAFFRDAPNQYLGLVDAFATQRVEVVRGAAGSRYGADAMGGVVNVLTRTPRFDGAQWARRSEVHAAFASGDDAWTGHAETAAGRDGLAVGLGATWQDHGHRTTGAGETIIPSAYRSRAANAYVLGAAGERGEFRLAAQVLEQPETPRVDELVAGFGQDHPSSAEYLFAPNRRSFLHARYRLDGDGGWFESLEANLARQAITDDRRSRDFGSSLRTLETNESVLDGLTLQLDTLMPSGALMIWGLEYYSDEVRSQRSRRDLAGGTSELVRSRFPDGSTMDSAAVYVSTEWFPSPRLTVDAGLRYSAFDIRLPATTDIDAVRLTPSDVTGDLNFLYALSDELHLAANIGRGFRPPNIFDLATLGPRPGNRFNVANPGLGPESVASYDLGIKGRNQQLQFEVFAFYLDYRDKITSVPTGEITPQGRIVVRGENRAEVRLFGLEAGLRWTFDERLEGYGVLNLTRAEERDVDGALTDGDRIPPLNGKLGLVYRPTADWRIESYWTFAARQDRLSPRDRRDPRIDPEGTPGWGALNLLLSWQANDRVQLGLKLENLGDVSYREHGSGIDAPGFNAGVWVNAAW